MMKYHLLITALFLLPASSVLAADGSGTLPSAEEIVTRMGAHDLQRQGSIEGNIGTQGYLLENHNFHKSAEMPLYAQGDPVCTKPFERSAKERWETGHKNHIH